MYGIEDVMRGKGITELRSQLDWNNNALVQFLAHAGFQLAPRVVLSREVAASGSLVLGELYTKSG